MDGSVSDLFCREECQQAWAARRIGADMVDGVPVSPDDLLRRQYRQRQEARRFLLNAEVFVAPVSTAPDLASPAWGPGVRDIVPIGRPGPTQLLAANEAVRAHWADFASRINSVLAPVVVEFETACRSVAENLALFYGHMVDAGVVEKPLPADPQARALALRKRRNTGPQQQRRAPRAINPRRAR